MSPSRPDSARGGNADGRISGERRLLTALCYDLVESTTLLNRYDLEDFQELIAAFQRIAHDVVQRHGGALSDLLGDGGIALFASDVDRRDAASSAVRTGLEIIEACRALAAERNADDLHVRIGIGTSMVLVEGSGGEVHAAKVTGAAPALAARLQAIAEPDSVVVSDQTRLLAGRSHRFADLGKVALKGFPEPERVWRAQRGRAEIDRFSAFGRTHTALIGRDRPLAEVIAAWDAAAGGRGAALVLEGEAGVGKSRLLREIARLVRRRAAHLLLLQCAPGGANSTLHPILNAMLNARQGEVGKLSTTQVKRALAGFGIADDDSMELLAFLLGAEGAKAAQLRELSPGAIRRRAAETVRRCLEEMTRLGPVLIAIEDIHWIDPTSLDLLQAAAAAAGELPVLIIVTTRPDPDDAAGLDTAARIGIGRLQPEETRRAIAALIPAADPARAEAWADLIHDATGGIPLFIEQICEWLQENPQLSLEADTLPARFEEIVAARLATVGAARQVALHAAVVGVDFDLVLLSAVLPDQAERDVRNALNRLEQHGLITRGRAPGMPSHSFRHALIREAIYATLLRKDRRAIHDRVFTAVVDDRDLAPSMGDAILAAHAESADRIEAAAELYMRAGRESSGLSALTESKRLLERALALCERLPDPATRDALTLTALSALGPVVMTTDGTMSPRACAIYEQGVDLARRRPEAERAQWFPIYWGWWFTGVDLPTQRERARVALRDLEGVSDPEVQLQVRHCVWAIEFNMGAHRTVLDAITEGLRLYPLAHGADTRTLYGGHDPKVCALGQRSLSLWFTGDLGEATASIDAAVDWARRLGHVGSLAHAYDIKAMLHRYQRDIDGLRATIAEMNGLAELHGLSALAAKARIFAGWCLGVAEDAAAGRAALEAGLDTLRAIETVEDFPVYSDMLAELMGLTGEVGAALLLLEKTIADADRDGHRYWLAELQHRRARLLVQAAADPQQILDALAASLALAEEQQALALVESAAATLRALDLAGPRAAGLRAAAEQARRYCQSAAPVL